jgi:8-oxo-dGTP diphosphatase
VICGQNGGVSELCGGTIDARHVPCAGGIVFDSRRRLLVILRGRPPSAGCWSVPGGRCRDGESAPDACVREVAEETGLRVRVERFAGRVARPGPAATVYDIDDFVCALADPWGLVRALEDSNDAVRAPAESDTFVRAPAEPAADAGPSVTLRAADDAIDAQWVTRAEFELLPLAPQLWETLESWGCLPS